jgi:hypothetical protein
MMLETSPKVTTVSWEVYFGSINEYATGMSSKYLEMF